MTHPAPWILLAVVEALYQGRYKVYAAYQGRPVLAVFLPDPDPDRLSVFVVGPACSRADGDVQYFTRVVRP